MVEESPQTKTKTHANWQLLVNDVNIKGRKLKHIVKPIYQLMQLCLSHEKSNWTCEYPGEGAYWNGSVSVTSTGNSTA